MPIEFDLRTIETLQNQFKADHGVFFEMDWSGSHRIPIPKESDVLDLRSIRRYLGPSDKIFPNKEVTEIPFVPTNKNYRFIIGRGLQIDGEGNLVKETWYCKAEQFDDEGNVLRAVIRQGGDKTIGIFKGN